MNAPRALLLTAAALGAAGIGAALWPAGESPAKRRASRPPGASRPAVAAPSASGETPRPADVQDVAAAPRPVATEELRRRLDDPALPPGERARALAALATADPPAATRAARAHAEAEQAGPLLAAALRALGPLAAAGHVHPGEARRLALRALARGADPEAALAAGDALDALAPPLADLEHALRLAPLPEARVALARAVARSDEARAREVVAALVRRDPSPLARAEALAALAARRDFDARLARDALDDPALTAAAARLLARDRGPEAERALVEAFGRACALDDARCVALARALAARAAAHPALVEAALAPTPGARAAVEALASAGALPEVRAALARARASAARVEALAALRRRGALPRPELEALARDPDPSLREAARSALASSEEAGG